MYHLDFDICEAAAPNAAVWGRAHGFWIVVPRVLAVTSSSCDRVTLRRLRRLTLWGGLIGESSSAVVGLATLGPPAVATTTALRTSHVTVLPGTGTALGCPSLGGPYR